MGRKKLVRGSRFDRLRVRQAVRAEGPGAEFADATVQFNSRMRCDVRANRRRAASSLLGNCFGSKVAVRESISGVACLDSRRKE